MEKTKNVISDVVKANKDGSYRFILSTDAKDSDNDIIYQDGWDMSRAKDHLPALWMHDHHKLPVGRWKNVKVTGGKLVGDLELAPAESSGFQKAINSLVDNGFIKAVSVGFRAKEYNERKDDDGYGYDITKAQLHEVSLVNVGAQPEALALAKSFCPDFDAELGEIETTKSGEDVDLKPASSEKKPKPTPNLDKAKSIIEGWK
ncbi:HK97 family phage prohead protease [Vibrio breoganii]|uniref:HK97 family phage prohead protease n=1 Tax=Vibrio breoganii TaxID=553239 RepID=UPI000C8373F3|nr:HK97 family phage prohead protease [Vibrio breoganii]PMK30654.1 hypothetical protein BCU03_09570 [Vibrio breoganii]